YLSPPTLSEVESAEKLKAAALQTEQLAKDLETTKKLNEKLTVETNDQITKLNVQITQLTEQNDNLSIEFAQTKLLQGKESAEAAKKLEQLQAETAQKLEQIQKELEQK